jgi:hypothetical protein
VLRPYWGRASKASSESIQASIRGPV